MSDLELVVTIKHSTYRHGNVSSTFSWYVMAKIDIKQARYKQAA